MPCRLNYAGRRACCTPPARTGYAPELFSAVADLADVAGYMAYDADAHNVARQVFGFALGCAEEAENWHLRAQILSNMAAPGDRYLVLSAWSAEPTPMTSLGGTLAWLTVNDHHMCTAAEPA